MKKNILLFGSVALAVAFAVWVLWANSAVELNAVTIWEENLPEEFYGLRIAHVSDLHSASFYMDVVDLLERSQPDIICITGDMMDCRDTSSERAVDFARKAAQIAPCYYITGNHETILSKDLYDSLIEGLELAGVTVLENREVILTRDGASVSIVGHFWGSTERIGELSEFDGYRILLSHQPEDFSNYCAGEYDLVLSGHAHGGQFRLPFIGGLYAPGQGVFPKYDAGVYTQGRTDMVVSRGIGNSSFPLRFNNRPEIILITLKTTQID